MSMQKEDAVIKISANISKKVPIPGTEFSSQQYGAAMEIEVSDADKPENIQARIRELYRALSVAIARIASGAWAAAHVRDATGGHRRGHQDRADPHAAQHAGDDARNLRRQRQGEAEGGGGGVAGTSPHR